MTLRLSAFLVGVFALLSAGHAQDRKKDEPARPTAATAQAKDQRTVYAIRGGDGAALTQVVKTHFKNKVAVTNLADSLVVSGEPDDLTEVVKLLAQIDKPAKTVEIEVTLVEVAGKADAAALPSVAELQAKLDDLGKAGATVQRIKLTAVEGQPVSVQTGGNKPYTSGSVVGRNPFGGGGPGGANPALGGGGPGVMQRSVSYHQVGTTVKATARVEADGAVGIDLNVQDSTIKPPEMGDDAAGGAPGFDTATLTTRVSVPTGKSVVVQAIRKDAKAAKTVTLVIVTAKVVESGK